MLVTKGLWQSILNDFQGKVRRSLATLGMLILQMPYILEGYFLEPSCKAVKNWGHMAKHKSILQSVVPTELSPGTRHVGGKLQIIPFHSCLNLPRLWSLPSWGPGIKEIAAILAGLCVDYSSTELISTVDWCLSYTNWWPRQQSITKTVSLALSLGLGENQVL